MSSTYRLICLSHNPGIELDTEWRSDMDGRVTAEHWLLQPAGTGATVGHAECDLVAGRYSYPLLEIGYLNGGTVRWVDTEWLRLLIGLHDTSEVIQKANVSIGPIVIVPLPTGWTPERARRLRGLLPEMPL